MASYAAASRDFARQSCRSLQCNGATRAYRATPRPLAAQNFTMPAMSPTMTEGNIASWKVTEGDSFTTGDVLLEIETDKAQMDVEAQEDGKMAKITQPDGSKAVKVGSRIAVIAEVDDDLSTLELPAEDSTSAPSPQEDLKSGVDPSKSSESQAEAPPSSKGADTPRSSSSSGSKMPRKQTYPLYPSIAALLHEKGISTSEADNIPASGPKGRLLKGDVLAHLGRISQSYPSEQSARITKLGHLDLSNVQIAAPAAAPSQSSTSAQPKTTKIPDPEQEPDTEIAVPISMQSVLEVQKRIQETLGVTMPLSTFIARATVIANDGLPRPANYRPSDNELFNQVLGLDKVNQKTSRGNFIPQVTALPTATVFRAPSGPLKKHDIIDILTGNPPRTSKPMVGLPSASALPGPVPTTNVFSVNAAKGEEKRARVFLERVKTILQVEPGRLVI
ncbi:MAG: hypothetical protein L6R36_002512 [Xanthoria steineri]|nr:MAG: hypothetical protein L6R36_002512 [Xanthoria steineri]